MNNTVFEKTMENVRNHRDIKFITTEAGRNYLVSEANFDTTKLFIIISTYQQLIVIIDNLLAIEMKRNWIITYKPVGLGLSIFQISKIVMNKILYDYMKPNMEKKQNYVTWTKAALQST